MTAAAAKKERDPNERFEVQAPSREVIEEALAKYAGEKVTICCKLPNGLTLRLFRAVEVRQPVMGGGTTMVVEHHEDVTRGRVHIRGNAHYMHLAPRSLIVAGYAQTPGVDKGFWEAWKLQNATLPALTEGLIFAAKNADTAHGMSEDRKDIVSNLHPLIPDRDARRPRPLNAALSPVQTAEKD